MSVIFKPLFDILTGDVAVCNNVLYNYLFMFLVGEVAFRLIKYNKLRKLKTV